MTISTAEYKASYKTVGDCPASTMAEYAFIGRSNVGKSSLINMLTGRKNLALTSATPGKTLLINYFLINKEWQLVDLPGYGYASIGKDARRKLKAMIDGYVLRRQELTNLFVLIDSRHEPQQIDLEFINFLGENGVPFSIAFTKADKLSRSKVLTNVEEYKKTLLETWETLPPIFITSARDGAGREEILAYIEQINASLK